MKKFLLNMFVFSLLSLSAAAQKYEFRIITTVESIVPSGLGRSRMVSSNDVRDYRDYTTTRSEEDNSRNSSDRSEIRVKGFDETKLLNFYNLGGIRFQNIAANDALAASKLSAMAEEGWELAFVNSAVESDAGKDDGNGIFITRYIFRKVKN